MEQNNSKRDKRSIEMPDSQEPRDRPGARSGKSRSGWVYRFTSGDRPWSLKVPELALAPRSCRHSAVVFLERWQGYKNPHGTTSLLCPQPHLPKLYPFHPTSLPLHLSSWVGLVTTPKKPSITILYFTLLDPKAYDLAS